jgi:hypothetical protein
VGLGWVVTDSIGSSRSSIGQVFSISGSVGTVVCAGSVAGTVVSETGSVVTLGSVEEYAGSVDSGSAVRSSSQTAKPINAASTSDRITTVTINIFFFIEIPHVSGICRFSTIIAEDSPIVNPY